MLRCICIALLTVLAMLLPQLATAQVVNNGQAAGVEVKADGVLRIKVYQGLEGPLAMAWQREAKAKLPADLARVSDKRKISLNRLEAAIKAQLDKGLEPTAEMQFLAGLTRVENVFFFPGSNDIVIAGPAEGFAPDPAGRTIGIFSGRATIELQDLVTALRAYPPGENTRHKLLGCSIDPTKDGLAKMAQFYKEFSKNISTPDSPLTGDLAKGMRESLGLQNVTINGVSPKTHFAQVLVEADYRMKLIGIGLETPPAKITSYVSKAKPSGSTNAMQRWYFQPNYECVRITEDHLAMQLVGDGVKLSNQSEVVGADGSRAGGGAKDPASETFVKTFTSEYGALAARVPVYAQLRNLIDLSIAAAFIQEQDYYTKAGWKASTLMNEKAVPVETCESPKTVESAVNAIWKGSRLLTPIGGGVTIYPTVALQTEHLLKDDNGELKAAREKVKVEGLAENQWWWD